MNTLPIVSVVIPTCNRPKFILRALEMVKRQTYKGIIHTIVVDNSDSFNHELASRDDCLYFYEKNLTIGAARNFGCNVKNSDYIVHWDDDDWYGNTRIEEQVEFLELNKNAFGMCAAGSYFALEVETERCFRLNQNWAGTASWCQRKDFHEQYPFQDSNKDDNDWYKTYQLLAKVPSPISFMGVEASQWFVMICHELNTSKKHTYNYDPASSNDVEFTMGSSDYESYLGLHQ
jgi:glycosyltransferase involved in cell wall biosynthesis